MTSRRPSSRASPAAVSRRRLRLAGSPSSAARLIAVTATGTAPLRRARAPASSSSSAMSSCSPESSAARCHARRSGWSWSTSASASWTRRRSARPGALRDRRADERMPEAERLEVGVHDAGLDRRPGGVEIHGGAGDGGARLEDLADPVLVAERGHQQEQSRRIGQIAGAVGERALEPLGQRHAAGHPLLVLVAADDGRELEDGERVAGRFVKHPGARPDRKLRGRRVEQGRGRRIVETDDLVLRQAGLAEHGGVAVTDRREQHDRVGLDPPRDERQRVRGRPVEPVGVLDDQQERGLGGDVREQVERGHGDPEGLGRGVRASGRTRHRARRAGRRGARSLDRARAGAADAARRTAGAPPTARLPW